MIYLPKITGNTWFNTQNSAPIPPESLKGKVVLVDFWTYSCINCIHTLPYMRKWWDTYRDKGLVIIGVHTPEFSFEKDVQNVAQAVKDLGVVWPVVLDNDYVNWKNFANHYWPAKYLANKSGQITYMHFGEGNYGETEAMIQMLLKQGDDTLTLPSPDYAQHQHGNVCFLPTPELYCGYSRGFLANTEGYKKDKTTNYRLPASLPADHMALSGEFKATPEYVESQDPTGQILVNFRGTEVDLVLSPVTEKSEIRIMLSGEVLPDNLKGSDVKNGIITVDHPKMYNLLKADKLVEGTLALGVQTGSIRAHAFAFSGCVEL